MDSGERFFIGALFAVAIMMLLYVGASAAMWTINTFNESPGEVVAVYLFLSFPFVLGGLFVLVGKIIDRRK